MFRKIDNIEVKIRAIRIKVVYLEVHTRSEVLIEYQQSLESLK